MTTPSAARPGEGRGGPALPIAWYAVVLAVVFTIAFWAGRMVGPTPVATERPPDAPHAPMGSHR
jgi:prolipoprotein diacylglyceryltransferase